jgi:hypothetical protein
MRIVEEIRDSAQWALDASKGSGPLVWPLRTAGYLVLAEGALAAVAADRAYQTASYTDALPHFKRAAGLGLMSGALAVANHLNRRSPVGDLSHQLGREHTSLVLVPSAMVAGVAALAEVQRGVEQMRAA